MPLYQIGGLRPELGDGAWAAPSADLIGDVRLGARASVWFGAVIRADNTPLILSARKRTSRTARSATATPDFPLTIGARVTVGHQAILHGCTIADDCLIGMGARILNGAVIETECMVGAGALITEGKRFERGSLIVGAPRGWCGSSPTRSGGCSASRQRTMPRKRSVTRRSCSAFELLQRGELHLRAGVEVADGDRHRMRDQDVLLRRGAARAGPCRAASVASRGASSSRTQPWLRLRLLREQLLLRRVVKIYVRRRWEGRT